MRVIVNVDNKTRQEVADIGLTALFVDLLCRPHAKTQSRAIRRLCFKCLQAAMTGILCVYFFSSVPQMSRFDIGNSTNQTIFTREGGFRWAIAKLFLKYSIPAQKQSADSRSISSLCVRMTV